MIARYAIAFVMAAMVLASPVFSAIVILDNVDGVDLSGDAPGKKDGMGAMRAVIGFQDALEDFRRFGIGEHSWKNRNDIGHVGFYVDQARSAFDAGKFEQARVLLEQANENLPDHPMIELAMAETLLELATFTLAKEWVDKAAENGMDPRLIDWYGAICLEGMGQPQQAAVIYQRMLQSDIESVRQRGLVGSLRLRVNSDDSFETIDEALNELLAQDASNPLIIEALMSLALREKRPEKALDYADALIAVAPDDARGHLGRIHALHQFPDGRRPMDVYTAFIRKFPDRNEGYIYLASALILQKKLDQAEKVLRSGLEKAEINQPVYHSLAQLYYNQGNIAAGVDMFSQLLQVTPTDAALWSDYLEGIDALLSIKEHGVLPFHDKDPDTGQEKHMADFLKAGERQDGRLAARHLLRAMAVGNASVGMFNDLGCLVAATLGAKPSLPFFMMALASSPNYREARSNLNSILARSTEREMKRRMEELEQAVRSDQVTGANCNELGELCARLGDLDKAIVFFKRAVEEDPSTAAYHMNHAQALYRAGDLSAAIKSIELSVAHRGEWQEPLYWQAWLLLQQGAQISEEELLIVTARERQLDKAEELYPQALGRYLRAKRSVITQSKSVAGIKVRDSMLYAEQHGIDDVYEMSRKLLQDIDE